MTFGERLTCLRKENGYPTRKEFANYLGIPETTLRNYEKDEREPGHTFLKKVSELFNVSADYLLGLKDDKEKTDLYQLKSSEWKLIERYRSFDSTGQSHIDSVMDWESERMDALMELESRQSNVIEFDGRPDVPARYIQFFQKVSAGSGQIIEEDLPPEQIAIPDIPEYRRVAYAVMVSGRSMEPLFQDGDMLLIEPACAVDIGEIGIFNVDGNAFVKKCGETELISLNPEYENIPLTNESRCMGKVVDRLREQ